MLAKFISTKMFRLSIIDTISSFLFYFFVNVRQKDQLMSYLSLAYDKLKPSIRALKRKLVHV